MLAGAILIASGCGYDLDDDGMCEERKSDRNNAL
jgi:hypothetical protein